MKDAMNFSINDDICQKNNNTIQKEDKSNSLITIPQMNAEDKTEVCLRIDHSQNTEEDGEDNKLDQSLLGHKDYYKFLFEDSLNDDEDEDVDMDSDEISNLEQGAITTKQDTPFKDLSHFVITTNPNGGITVQTDTEIISSCPTKQLEGRVCIIPPEPSQPHSVMEQLRLRMQPPVWGQSSICYLKDNSNFIVYR